ncbi:MAG: hypothetical protein AABZ74_15720 [Cyanobacteriota bacterium]
MLNVLIKRISAILVVSFIVSCSSNNFTFQEVANIDGNTTISLPDIKNKGSVVISLKPSDLGKKNDSININDFNTKAVPDIGLPTNAFLRIRVMRLGKSFERKLSVNTSQPISFKIDSNMGDLIKVLLFLEDANGKVLSRGSSEEFAVSPDISSVKIDMFLQDIANIGTIPIEPIFKPRKIVPVDITQYPSTYALNLKAFGQTEVYGNYGTGKAPSVGAKLSNGNYIMIWADDQDNSGRDPNTNQYIQHKLYAMIIDKNGVAISQKITLSTSYNSFNPKLAVYKNRFILGYNEGEGNINDGSYTLKAIAKIFDNNLNEISKLRITESSMFIDNNSFRIVSNKNSDGDFIIATLGVQMYIEEKPKGSYIGTSLYSPPSNQNIAMGSDSSFFTCSRNASSSLVVEKFNPNGENVGKYTMGSSGDRPSIGLDSSNNFILAWNNYSEIRFRMYDSNGNPRDLESVNDNSLNTGFESFESEPQIHVRGDGSFILVYMKTNYYPDKNTYFYGASNIYKKIERGIYVKAYNRLGQAVGNAIEIDKPQDYNISSPIITGDDNSIMVVWKKSNSAQNGYETYTSAFKIFDIQ